MVPHTGLEIGNELLLIWLVGGGRPLALTTKTTVITITAMMKSREVQWLKAQHLNSNLSFTTQ